MVDPEDDYWKGEDPMATPPTPVVDGKVDKGDEDYWDARCMFHPPLCPKMNDSLTE